MRSHHAVRPKWLQTLEISPDHNIFAVSNVVSITLTADGRWEQLTAGRITSPVTATFCVKETERSDQAEKRNSRTAKKIHVPPPADQTANQWPCPGGICKNAEVHIVSTTH